MISVITLVHNQASNLPIILEAYEIQTLQPYVYIFVLDRCTDESENIIKMFSNKHNTEIINNNNGLDFQAGYCRDLGLLRAKTNVLFLDGDCIPTPELFYEVDKELNSNEPKIVISKRKNRNKDNVTYIVDSRESTPWYKNWIFGEYNTLVEHLELSRIRMLTWSCSLGLNMNAISIIKEINSKIGYQDRLFPTIFDGMWGGEDDHIGHVAMFMCIKIIGLSINHYVTHIWHESKNNEKYMNNSLYVYNKLKGYCESINAPGLFYAAIDIDKHVSNYLSEMRSGKLELDVIIDEPFDEY